MTQAWDFVDARILWEYRKYVRVADIRLDSLILSTRALSALDYACVYTLGELAELTESEMMRQPNCGRKTMEEIREVLAYYGLCFRTTRKVDDFVMANLVKELAEK